MRNMEEQQTWRGFSRYPAYKDSGAEWLGQIPAHWEVKRLKYVCRRSGLYGANEPAGSYTDDGVRFIRTSDIDDDGSLNSDGAVYLEASLVQDYLLEEGDFLLSRSGTLGRSFVYCRNQHGECAYAGYLVRFVLNNSFLPRLAFYFTKSLHFSDWLSLSAIQSTIGNVNGQKYANMPLPVPPLSEQLAIADFLDRETAKIDALVAKKERLIELLQEQRIALISHAVTKGLDPRVPMKDLGIEWLGMIPAHWVSSIRMAVLALDSRGAFVNGPFGSDLLTSELVETGVPVIYIRDIKPEGYQRSSTAHVTIEKAAQLEFCRVDPGDVLIAKVGDPPGTAATYPESEPPGIVTQDVIRLKPKPTAVISDYLPLLLNSKYGQAVIEQSSVESTRTRIGLGTLKNTRVVLPPVHEQRAITYFIKLETAKIKALHDKVRKAIEKLKEYRTALISAAVTGKIDVRGVGAHSEVDEVDND
jgi:type I restriction enzyme, S subunit